eukprot:TRINITY_DN17529_c0_g1_i1.p1 TRINITY_DN17529_c0_g1~~TRINITY_DN17529_c0_g1_i1.p1  ORF type:complete len:419 (-),score=62.32 TRINITY_DN17529_c0_g1_i1:197-1423(-)
MADRDIEQGLLSSSKLRQGLTRSELQELYESNDAALQSASAYDVLEALHEVPGEIQQYNVEPFHALFHFRGTILELIFMRADFWLLFVLHCVFVVWYYRIAHQDIYGYGPDRGHPTDTAIYWPKASASLVAVPGTLLAFLQVFYVNQSYRRYSDQYEHCCRIKRAVGQIIGMLRVQFYDNAFPYAQDVRLGLSKLITATHMVGYVGLPQSKEANTDLWALWFLQNEKVLEPGQVPIIRDLLSRPNGELALHECQQWFMHCVWAQVHKGHIPEKVAVIFMQILSGVRIDFAALHAYTAGPIPFAYFHLQNFILISYLLVYAYCFTFMTRMWTIPAYFITLVAQLGLRELGNNLSNPFGHDAVDLPILKFVYDMYLESKEGLKLSPEYEGEPEYMKPVRKAYRAEEDTGE